MKNLFLVLLATLAIVIGGVILSAVFEITPIVAIVSSVALTFGASFAFVGKRENGAAYETIAVEQARGIYTQALASVYREKVPVMGFLRSFFTTKIVNSKLVSIEVSRGKETIAVDVIRGTNGNRNKTTRSTMKAFLPPYFDEYFNVNELDIYDRAIGSTNPNDMIQLVQESAMELESCRDKIDRRVELMCAEVFETGIITLVNGEQIDFKRKAASKLAYNTSYNWADNAVLPHAILLQGAKFLRETGKSQGANMNVIVGSSALSAFFANTKTQARQDLVNLKLDQLASPVKNGLGASYHGRISEGAYTFDLWSYPEIYTDADGNNVPYWNPKKVCVLPEMPKFDLIYAQVPQLIGAGATQSGAYLIQDFIDARQTSHEQHIKSAAIPVPAAVDQMFTAQVLA